MTNEESIRKISTLAEEFKEDGRDRLSKILEIVASAINWEMEKELHLTIIKGIVTRGKEIQQELLKIIDEAKEN